MTHSALETVWVIQETDGLSHDNGCVAVFGNEEAAEEYGRKRAERDPMISVSVRQMPVMYGLPALEPTVR